MKTKLVFTLFCSIVLSSSLVLASAAPVLDISISDEKQKKPAAPKKEAPKKVVQKPVVQKPVVQKSMNQKPELAKPIPQKSVEAKPVVVKTKKTEPTEVKKIDIKSEEKKTADKKNADKKAAETKKAEARKAAVDLHKKNAPSYENKNATLAGARLTPTVYFLPTFDLDKDSEAQCSEKAKKTIHGFDGEKKIKVCPEVYASCLLQGTCHLIKDGQKITIGYSTQKKGIHYFEIEEGESRCPYGVGVRNVCMDPYFTVAADLRYNKLGDVIYVPDVVGTVLPGGYKHNGYFIVRDKGGAIKGAHRYDFYIGESLPGKETSPFHHLNLQSKKHKKYYYYIKGEAADKFRAARNFKYPRAKVAKRK